MHPRVRAAFLVFAIAVAACARSLPTAPSELTEGIVIYPHGNFGGGSAHVTADLADLGDFTGPCVEDTSQYSATYGWGDCISSVRVAPGWRATLYGDAHFKGTSLDVTADVPDLARDPGGCGKGMDDCVSSIRISRQ
jgi:hypothetical protein